MDATRRDRIETLANLLQTESIPEIWLARPENFAWLTGGDSKVVRTGAMGAAAAGFDGEEIQIVTPNNEADRFREEEVQDPSAWPVDIEVHSFDWHESDLPSEIDARSKSGAVVDTPVAGIDTIDIGNLRSPLTAEDVEAYRTDGVDATIAVESVASELSPSTTEREAAGRLFDELFQRGFDVPVALVGGADRSQRHRHFTPKDEPLEEFAHLTVVAEREGRQTALTRTLAFDPPAWLKERHDAACRVAATAIAATANAAKETASAGDVFAEIVDAYEAVGHPDEWRRHHQGGAIGFEPREWVATPDSDQPVLEPMAYAWNPTVKGAKCEDTVLVTDDSIDVLTETHDWPTTEYDAIGYDKSIAFHDIWQVES